jgi:hypothetical protein
VKTTIFVSSVARGMLGSLHAMREMVIAMVCLRIYARKVAVLQKPIWTGIYEALMDALGLVLRAGSLILTAYRLVLSQNPED